jgi:hypothetical protein
VAEQHPRRSRENAELKIHGTLLARRSRSPRLGGINVHGECGVVTPTIGLGLHGAAMDGQHPRITRSSEHAPLGSSVTTRATPEQTSTHIAAFAKLRSPAAFLGSAFILRGRRRDRRRGERGGSTTRPLLPSTLTLPKRGGQHPRSSRSCDHVPFLRLGRHNPREWGTSAEIAEVRPHDPCCPRRWRSSGAAGQNPPVREFAELRSRAPRSLRGHGWGEHPRMRLSAATAAIVG